MMKETIANILNKPYSRNFIQDENGTYSAEILEFSGCYSQGNTIESALNNLNDVAKEWIEATLEIGQEIPEPNMNKGYSGRIVLRMPKGIHRKAALMAENEGVSLNHFLVTSVSTRIGAEDFFYRLANRFEQRMVSTALEIRWMQQHEDAKFIADGTMNIPLTLDARNVATTEATYHG